MDRSQALAILRGREAELRQLGLGALYLFGSVARGEADAKDVDLLFEAGDDASFSLLRQGDAMARLEQILGQPVDLVERACVHERLRPRIEADLVRVY